MPERKNRPFWLLIVIAWGAVVLLGIVFHQILLPWVAAYSWVAAGNLTKNHQIRAGDVKAALWRSASAGPSTFVGKHLLVGKTRGERIVVTDLGDAPVITELAAGKMLFVYPLQDSEIATAGLLEAGDWVTPYSLGATQPPLSTRPGTNDHLAFEVISVHLRTDAVPSDWLVLGAQVEDAEAIKGLLLATDRSLVVWPGP